MNKIGINPREITDTVIYESILFSEETFIDLTIDGVAIENISNLAGGTIFWPELKRSIIGSGEYLIFTCYCGIADDAGWNLIAVEHNRSTVSWTIKRHKVEHYVFPKSSYVEGILECERRLNLGKYPLAVESAFFPEY